MQRIAPLVLSPVFLFASSLLAQGSGAITGNVTGPAGAAIPNAANTINNTATNASRTITSDAIGFYNTAPSGPEILFLSQ